MLSDINGMHVKPEHVFAAMDAAQGGSVAEGSVGGGTGMICHGFKGGIGTSSRVLDEADGGWIVGALAQANYGSRHLLRVDGVPVGRELPAEEVPTPLMTPAPTANTDTGSIIVILATNAPLIPLQCRRLAQRATLGVARMGGLGANGSGDLFLAFATGNEGLARLREPRGTLDVRMLTNDAMSPLFEAAGEAVEESILNALCMATTVTGIAGRTAHALPLDRLREIMRRYGRLTARKTKVCSAGSLAALARAEGVPERPYEPARLCAREAIRGTSFQATGGTVRGVNASEACLRIGMGLSRAERKESSRDADQH